MIEALAATALSDHHEGKAISKREVCLLRGNPEFTMLA
jgi:hypothetical protein